MGVSLASLMFFPRLLGAGHDFPWVLLHASCGPLEKALFGSAALTHLDVFFAAVLLFMTCCHVFSMRRAPAILSFVGAFLWIAAAVGHH